MPGSLTSALGKYRRGTRGGSRTGGSPWAKQESEPLFKANPSDFVTQQPDRVQLDPKKFLKKTRSR